MGGRGFEGVDGALSTPSHPFVLPWNILLWGERRGLLLASYLGHVWALPMGYLLTTVHMTQCPQPIFKAPHAPGGQDEQHVPCRQDGGMAKVCALRG